MIPKPFDTYAGSKDAAGAAERIISLMPAHTTYAEMCVVGGAILRRKKPADRSFIVDSDGEVLLRWRALQYAPGIRWIEVIEADATRPESWPSSLAEAMNDRKTVAYFDPPYLPDSRRDSAGYVHRRYAHEMTLEDHKRLLAVVKQLPCFVLLSGYASELYDRELKSWHVECFQVGTRGSARMEFVWMNFDPRAVTLHDTRFVGDGFRERERIKKKRDRWARRFRDMDPRERQVIAEALASAVTP